MVRRAVRYADEFLGAPPDFFSKLVPSVVETLGCAFPSLVENQETIKRVLREEETVCSYFCFGGGVAVLPFLISYFFLFFSKKQLFRRTLKNGKRKFENIVKKMEKNGQKDFPSGEAAKLFTTYGFPADLTRIMCEERELNYDECAVDVSLFIDFFDLLISCFCFCPFIHFFFLRLFWLTRRKNQRRPKPRRPLCKVPPPSPSLYPFYVY